MKNKIFGFLLIVISILIAISFLGTCQESIQTGYSIQYDTSAQNVGYVIGFLAIKVGLLLIAIVCWKKGRKLFSNSKKVS